MIKICVSFTTWAWNSNKNGIEIQIILNTIKTHNFICSHLSVVCAWTGWTLHFNTQSYACWSTDIRRLKIPCNKNRKIRTQKKLKQKKSNSIDSDSTKIIWAKRRGKNQLGYFSESYVCVDRQNVLIILINTQHDDSFENLCLWNIIIEQIKRLAIWNYLISSNRK